MTITYRTNTPAEARCFCGVFQWAHLEGRGCGEYRRASSLRLWLMDHYLRQHIAGWAWMHLWTEKARWRAAHRFSAKHPELCWCDMVDAILLNGTSDYRAPNGCGCHVPMLRDARPVIAGRCYCTFGATE